MKKPNLFLIFLFFLSASISCNWSSLQYKKETLQQSYSKILKVNLNYYIGKDVQLFLNDKRLPTAVKYRFVDDPPGSLSNLNIEYKNKIYIDIYVKSLVYTKQIDTARNWQLKNFEKEKIFRINVLKGDKIIKSVYR